MSRRVGGLQLALAFARNRRAQTLALLTLGFAFGAATLGLSIVRSSAEHAIVSSLRADLGGRSYALQTADPSTITTLRGLPDAAGVQDEEGQLTARELTGPVLVREFDKPSLQLGVLTHGERPHQVGDILLSELTAKALGASLGDAVRIRAGDLEVKGRVVGYSVDPADRNASTAMLLVDGASPQFRPTRWLSDTDFYEVPALRTPLDRRTATYQSVEVLLTAAAENRPQFLSALRFVPAGSGILLGILVVATCTAFARGWKTDVEALVAAGMAPARSWQRILRIITAVIVCGEFLGAGVIFAAVWLARDSVSGWFAQRWTNITVPWQEPVLLFALTAAASVLAMPATRLVQKISGRVLEEPRRYRLVTPIMTLIGAAGIATWLFGIRQMARPVGDHSAIAAPIGAIVIAAAIPYVLTPLLSRGARPASAALVRHLLNSLRPVAAAAAVVVIAASAWAAVTTADANAGEAASSPLEPPGSFVISRIPDQAVPDLRRLYASHGGTQLVTFQIPDESAARLRVTSTALVTCMAEKRAASPDQLPEDCYPRRAAAPINTVMLGAPNSPQRADPHLLVNDKVGLMLFTSTDGTTSRLADTSAAPDPMLGGNLPGLVVAPDSNVARQFGLTAAGTSEVVLLDFARLAPRAQFLIRSGVLRLAPGAQTADGTDPSAYDRLRSVANIVSFLGAAAAALVILLGGCAMVIAHAVTRQSLIDIGSRSRPRRTLVARWIALPIVSASLALLLAIFTASEGGRRDNAEYGLLWLLPGGFAIVASLIVAATFLRVPPAPRD